MSVRRAPRAAAAALGRQRATGRSLARWVGRRPDVPAGSTAIGYAQLPAPMLWLLVFGAAIETVVLDVVLGAVGAGWAQAIRIPVLLLGVWIVLWMLGQLAASRVRPHLQTDDDLVVRNGDRTWVRVPLEAVAQVRQAEHEYEGLLRSFHHEGELILVGVNVRTNLELTLDRPRELDTSHGRRQARRVGLWVDDPRAAAALLTVRPAATDG